MNVELRKLTVHASADYGILIDRGLFDKAGKIIKEVSGAEKACIITDSNVSKIYLKSLVESLEGSGFSTCSFMFNAGESSKTLQTVEGIYKFLSKNNITRTDLIVSLGGGVVGDISGFAAATYLRGVDFIQIPTTLLAQIDASVGGKTGVNLSEGKNLVGAFWQPKLVIIDPDMLITLPQEIFIDGMSEAIKYGCIKSENLFNKISKYNNFDDIEDIIYECVNIKCHSVENDERDLGKRMLLNFGHTIGHALEKIEGYGGISHGRAVAIGMAMIAELGEKKGLTEPGSSQRIINILKRFGLPFRTDAPKSEIINAIRSDKKNLGNSINLILIRRIGEGYIYRTTPEKIF